MPDKFVNIAFNLPIDKLFTYSIPEELEFLIKPGMRVLAPFGKKVITGIVVDFIHTFSAEKIKSIKQILDTIPILNQELMNFCSWISEYYICPLGEVLFSAIPKGINIETNTYFSLNENTENLEELTPLQKKIIDELKNKPFTIKQLENIIKSPSIRNALNHLHLKGFLNKEEVLSKEKVRPKYDKYLKFELINEFKDYTSQSINIFFQENNFKTQSQQKVLKYLIKNNISEAKLADIMKNTRSSSSVFKSLEKKGYIKIFSKQVLRENPYDFSKDNLITELNSDQLKVIDEITKAFGTFKTFLLFGVTGSGKTQVYIEVIKIILKLNKTAIVLVPEISLTPQLIHRFKTNFGNIIGVIHSKLTNAQKYDVNLRIKSGEIKIVIGARSAIFAPLENIGVIIVDEEHDQSFKQTDKNPKYNGRDCAVVRAKLNNAIAILGSATPSLESFYNYKADKYKLLELPLRALNTKQPSVEIVNMIDELKHPVKYKKYETQEQRVFSSKLLSYIDYALSKKQNIIIMQNRRGYSAYQQCLNCGNVKMCNNCDITMIYHKSKNHLRCHYCSNTEILLTNCEICGSNNLKLIGIGTEKIEEELHRIFPNAKTMRMDSDTVKGKDAYRKILKSFHDGEFDILIGTQMISKGLDFPNVYLVGVISADIGLYLPDFRSSEKTFQLLMQVAGRSGRISNHGKVVIQTMNPENRIFEFVATHNYLGFFENEIKYRLLHKYPPFSKMMLIEVTSLSQINVNNLSWKIYNFLNSQLLKSSISNNIEILKPAPALIYKLKNTYRIHIIIKILKSSSNTLNTTEQLIKSLNNFCSNLKIKSSERVDIDVDPVSFF
jgi:primosomal protein N' (replication factor Y)